MAGGAKRQPLAVPSQALREPDLGTQKIMPPCIPRSEGFEELDSNEASLPPCKMRPRGCLGFGLADSIFQSSLLGRERVGLGMIYRSVGAKVGEKWVRMEILTQDTFWKVHLNFLPRS